MKCRKGQYILIKGDTGIRWYLVVKGCNSENGWVEIHEKFRNGWCQKTSHRASEILEVKK